MYQKKIAGACFIFLLLFVAAWKIEHANKRIFVPAVEQIQLSETIPINSVPLPFKDQPMEMFKSREYVRIFGVLD
jgi:hypothetical protein